MAQPGLADERVEGAVYDFTIKAVGVEAVGVEAVNGEAVGVEAVNGEAVNGGPVAGGLMAGESFSLTLHGADLMFDGHTFAPGSGAGLVPGDIVVRP